MKRIAPRRARQLRLDTLESRITPNATPVEIAAALDLPAGTVVNYSGDPLAVSRKTFAKQNGFIGFPSGADNDYLILSTGVADKAIGANTSGSQGTDLGPGNVNGDTATLSFVLPVPASATSQRLKLEFVFLSEEFPEFVGSEFNDFFNILVNGQNIAQDQFGNPISINSAFFSDLSAKGTIFDGRTSLLTASYNVPAGETSLVISMSIGDIGDGIYDSAAFLDNVRFESPQTVFLDFDGATVTDHFAPDTSVEFPAFQASDVLGNPNDTATIISSIVSGLEAKFAGYDIIFTTTQPASSGYSTLVFGGNNDLAVDITGAPEIYRNQFASSTPTLREVAGIAPGTARFGQAGAIDVGNTSRTDLGVVFTDEFDNAYSAETTENITKRLIVTAAHELGHNLGLRHVDDSFTNDIMSEFSPRSPDAGFTAATMDLAEDWSDDAVDQNDAAYLASAIGLSTATSLIPSFITQFQNLGLRFSQTIYNLTLVYNPSGALDSSSGEERIFKSYHFDKFDGSFPLPLPVMPVGTKVAVYGSTQKSGALDLYSGVPVNGVLNYGEMFFDLYDAEGDAIGVLPLSQGELGSLVPFGSATFAENVVPKTGVTVKDTDGDLYTIRLTGPGLASVIFEIPGGEGPIKSIKVVGTDPAKSILSITVKPFKGVPGTIQQGGMPAGDGRVSVGKISGDGLSSLKSIKAPKANLIGDGIEFAGPIGAIDLFDVMNGADITTGPGGPTAFSSLKFHVIQSGSDINIGTPIKSFTAAKVGDGTITAPSIGKLMTLGDRNAAIVGDFGSDLTLTGALGTAVIKGNLAGAAINAQSIKAILADAILDSSVFAGYTPTSAADPLGGGTFNSESFIGSITTRAKNNSFFNSFVGASTIGIVNFATLSTDNIGTPFGLIAGTYSKSVKVRSAPAFLFNPTGAADQSMKDFHVVRVI